jgi:diguanylate cyclase (GGDEF)-like protein
MCRYRGYEIPRPLAVAATRVLSAGPTPFSTFRHGDTHRRLPGPHGRQPGHDLSCARREWAVRLYLHLARHAWYLRVELRGTPSTHPPTTSSPQKFTTEARKIIKADIDRLTSGELSSSVVVEAIHKDGQPIWLENKVRVLDQQGDVLFVLVAMRDITEKKRMHDQIARLAVIDGLTSLHNRRAFDERFSEEWSRALRSGDPLSILLLDIDHFKRINDSYSHLVGDDCIRAVATAIRGTVQRGGGFITRYGGEEFIVILPNTDSAAAQCIVEQVLLSVSGLQIPNAGDPEGHHPPDHQLRRLDRPRPPGRHHPHTSGSATLCRQRPLQIQIPGPQSH